MADEPDVDADELEPDRPDNDSEPDDTDDQPDAGDTDDEPEGEQPGEGGEPGEQPPQPDQQRQPASRAERRITAQQEELRRRDQQISDLNKRLDAVLATSRQPAPPQETAEQRESRLAMLDPVERMRVELQESQANNQRTMAQMAFTFQDGNDKAAYDAKASIDPLYKKWGPKVEEALMALRSRGQNVSREDMLAHMIGKAALAGRQTAGGQQRKEAGRRMARNRTAPSNSRSDTHADRRGGSDANALEKRLENVQI